MVWECDGRNCIFGECTLDAATNVTLCVCQEGFKHDRSFFFYEDCGMPFWGNYIMYAVLITVSLTGMGLSLKTLLEPQGTRSSNNAQNDGLKWRRFFLFLTLAVCMVNLFFALAHMYEGRMGPISIVANLLSFATTFGSAGVIMFVFRQLLYKLSGHTHNPKLLIATLVLSPGLFIGLFTVFIILAASHTPTPDATPSDAQQFNLYLGVGIACNVANTVVFSTLLRIQLGRVRGFFKDTLDIFEEDAAMQSAMTDHIVQRSSRGTAKSSSPSIPENGASLKGQVPSPRVAEAAMEEESAVNNGFLELAYLQKFAHRLDFFDRFLTVVQCLTITGQISIVVFHFLGGFPMFWLFFVLYWLIFGLLWVPFYRVLRQIRSKEMVEQSHKMKESYAMTIAPTFEHTE